MLKALRALAFVSLLSSFAFASQSPATLQDGLLSFEVNRGQTAPNVQYLSRTHEGISYFTSDGVTVRIPNTGVVRFLFDGSSNSAIEPGQRLPSHTNYVSVKHGTSFGDIENYSD